MSEGLARNAMAAKIDGEVKDLRTIIEKDCKLEILTFDDLDGKKGGDGLAVVEVADEEEAEMTE